MEVDLIYYELKLQSLLEKFLENGYHIKNDVYFNRLLSLLGGKENKELAEILLKLPLMTEWIRRAVQVWEDKSQVPDHTISSFTFQLLALISKNEFIFKELVQYDIYNRIVKTLQVQNKNSSPTVKLGFIKLLISLVSHSSGTEWLSKTTYWQDIISSSLQNETIYITKEGHLFIASFLNAMLIDNSTFSSDIWQTIITPLLRKPDDYLRTSENIFEACDDKIEKYIGPTVALVNEVLEFFFEKYLEPGNQHLRDLINILQKTQIIKTLTTYLYIIRSENLIYEIGRIWIMLQYLSIMAVVTENVTKPDIDKEFLGPIFSLLTILLENMKPNSIIKLNYIILIHWYKLRSILKFVYTIESQEYRLEDQFLFLNLFPNHIFCRAICDDSTDPFDLRMDVMTNVFSRMSKNSTRFAYKWRDCLGAEEVTHNICPKAMSYILQLKPLLSRDNAVMVFQSLLFVLFNLNELTRSNNHYVSMLSKCELFVKSIFETLAEIIIQFSISWNDTIQSLCVFRASVEFLDHPQWPSKIVIANLNLIKVGISNYLSPNLALLIDKPTSAIWILGNLLPAKLHDPEWSVRDSALELISVIAESAKIEFPSFQKVLLANDLCSLVLSVSIHDGESFVRASALRCLNNLVAIDTFWNNDLKKQEIIEKMMTVLKYETEGIVRAEAVSLLNTIFKYQGHDINGNLRKEICRCMCASGIDDLHWEVRLNSLVFWEDMIDQKLEEQGMVDGVFPKFTFSPESKKIVNLTDVEIRKRIMIALKQLSDMGCLTVLKHTISDDCDLQISKKGLEISKSLLDLIEKYNIEQNSDSYETGPPSNDSCYSSIVTSPPLSIQNREDIIEQMLGVSDTDLLRDIYNPNNDYTLDVHEPAKPIRHLVTPAEFIEFAGKNFKSLVSEREKWISSLDSLSSLLNDMLESYEPTDTNEMDCY